LLCDCTADRGLARPETTLEEPGSGRVARDRAAGAGSFDRVTVGKEGLARSSMGLICGNPPRPAGMRIPTRLLQRAWDRRSRPRQFLRRKSAGSVAPPPGCPATGSTRSLLQNCSKPRSGDSARPHALIGALTRRLRCLLRPICPISLLDVRAGAVSPSGKPQSAVTLRG
jgi:hypothetical protein